jgi:hypothetical protein
MNLPQLHLPLILKTTMTQTDSTKNWQTCLLNIITVFIIFVLSLSSSLFIFVFKVMENNDEPLDSATEQAIDRELLNGDEENKPPHALKVYGIFLELQERALDLRLEAERASPDALAAIRAADATVTVEPAIVNSATPEDPEDPEDDFEIPPELLDPIARILVPEQALPDLAQDAPAILAELSLNTPPLNTPLRKGN